MIIVLATLFGVVVGFSLREVIEKMAIDTTALEAQVASTVFTEEAAIVKINAIPNDAEVQAKIDAATAALKASSDALAAAVNA